jgi:ribosome production factor 2
VIRALKKKEPKLRENPKNSMFIRGESTNETVLEILKDFGAMKKPEAKTFTKKNKIRPFDDASSIEFFGQKSDCSLFMFGSHSKKRPNNIVIGRLFDYHILDMIELGLQNYKGIKEFVKSHQAASGSKPCFVFMGDEFDSNETHQVLSNLFLYFFRGTQLSKIDLETLDHIIILTAMENSIYFRHYSISVKKSDTKLPRVELEEIGPSCEMVIRRTRFASEDLRQESLSIPRSLVKKKDKNIIKTPTAIKARVHTLSQDFNQIATKKMKGLKRKRNDKDQASPWKDLRTKRQKKELPKNKRTKARPKHKKPRKIL